MTDYVVIAECVDERTGQRYQRGQKFPNPTPAQEDRLTKAGCIRKPTDDEAKLAQAEENARQQQLATEQAELARKTKEAAAAETERDRQRQEAQGEIDRLAQRLAEEARQREALVEEHKRALGEISAKLDEALAKRADAEAAAVALQGKVDRAAVDLSEAKTALAAEVDARKKAEDALAAAQKPKKG
ncbi:hypothetical protein [Bosea sp. FBZP-16]|uniref:hypothetical protein n=1 Tax=Bosea sp. FBZP-16 TaxID=2065382 RepID=UPI000C310CE1|nr:hypothetical protein [Bosea sp. FBZP-16]